MTTIRECKTDGQVWRGRSAETIIKRVFGKRAFFQQERGLPAGYGQIFISNGYSSSGWSARSATGRVIIQTMLLVLLLCGSAQAQTVEYEYSTIDISVPGHPELVAFPEDINDKGEIVSTIRIASTSWTFIVQPPGNRRGNKQGKSGALFDCGINGAFTEALGWSINNKGQVAGACGGSAFVRDRNGQITLISFPGDDLSQAFGISEDGKVIGQYWGPLIPGHSGFLRVHCFIWEKNQYRQIDLPMSDAFANCYGINSAGQVLGEYYRYTDPDNVIFEHGHFIYDNGTFTFPFPQSFEYRGGPSLFTQDMNELGQAIILRWNDGHRRFQLFDDGVLFDITPPPSNWLSFEQNGMNNKGEFVGTYSLWDGNFDHPPTHHGFIAKPVPLKTSRK